MEIRLSSSVGTENQTLIYVNKKVNGGNLLFVTLKVKMNCFKTFKT
jgi:hypothetical protein